MKIKFTNKIKNLINSNFILEKKVDMLRDTVNRNKLKAPANSNIDVVMSYTKNLNISHRIY